MVLNILNAIKNAFNKPRWLPEKSPTDYIIKIKCVTPGGGFIRVDAGFNRQQKPATSWLPICQYLGKK